MAEVERSRAFEGTPAELWQRVGDFHGLHTWHPGIANSEPSQDGGSRRLTLADGGEIVETRTNEGELSYSYRIDKSPLPVGAYESTILVREADGGGAEVVWSAVFEVDGISDAEGAELIAGFYDAGFDNLG